MQPLKSQQQGSAATRTRRNGTCIAYCLRLLCLAIGLLGTTPSHARKTNGPVYEEPFDIAGGGASLTRATQEGNLFSNPALLPYGGTFFRWFGLKTQITAGKQSVDFAKDMAGGDTADTSAIVDTAFTTPLHFGAANLLSFITNNGGLCLFYKVEPDFSASKYGAAGVPQINVKTEGYGGAVGSFAIRTPFRWWSLGVTGKYLYVTEPSLSVNINDSAALENIADSADLTAFQTYNIGTGVDVGSLWFFQGETVDLRIAAKVDDVGNTKLAGDAEPSSFRQTVSSGLGLTLHNEADALHLAVDYRDILGAYEEDLFKRIRMGAKVVLRTYVGVAAGYYDGYPSYGAELDIILLRIAGTYYTREMGEHAGVDPRPLYVLTINTGF